MKILSGAVAASLFALALPGTAIAQADDGAAALPEARHQLAREIIDNGFPPDTRLDLFGATMEQIASQISLAQPQLRENPEIEQVILRFRQRALDMGMELIERHLDDLMDGMVVAYADMFTFNELQALHAFVTSPHGHGFLAKSSLVNGHPAFAAANQAYINDYLAELPQLQQDLQAELMELFAEQEDAPEAS